MKNGFLKLIVFVGLSLIAYFFLKQLIISILFLLLIPVVPERLINPLGHKMNQDMGYPEKSYSVLYFILSQAIDLINYLLFFIGGLLKGLIVSVKFLTWIVLCLLIFLSLFKVYGANLTNNILGVALMLLLVTLFSDLKEFDFWGLKGKKVEELKNLEDKQGISPSDTKIKTKEVAQAERQPIQLMDNDSGNFLKLAIEIERLLRIYATVNIGKEIQPNINPLKLVKELKDKGLLTDNGVKQLDAIRWLRNLLLHGREQEVNKATLDAGTTIAWNLYQELFNTLYPQTKDS
jgi:hypothetical protein